MFTLNYKTFSTRSRRIAYLPLLLIYFLLYIFLYITISSYFILLRHLTQQPRCGLGPLSTRLELTAEPQPLSNIDLWKAIETIASHLRTKSSQFLYLQLLSHVSN